MAFLLALRRPSPVRLVHKPAEAACGGLAQILAAQGAMGMRRQTRGGTFRILLPLLLAALLLAGAFSRARWLCQSEPTISPAAPERDDVRSAPAEGPQARAQGPVAPRPLAPLSTAEPPYPKAAVPSAPPSSTQAPSPDRSHPHFCGPAPEPVAPSPEVALRASQPPPVVASAPRPAPAPSSLLVPTPEPKAASRIAPPVGVESQPGPPAAAVRPSQRLHEAWAKESVRSVRFDAGYYYGKGRSARDLAEELVGSWAGKGVNLIYFYAYNRVYGARYRTRYPGNVMEDYGRQDLLGHMIRAAHQRGIKVVAWFYGPQHKQVWETHPEWREQTADGKDYRPTPDAYQLCASNPDVMKWWLGLVDEVLVSYPGLDGVDIAEPQVDTWGDQACHCAHCRSEFAQTYPGAAAAGPNWRQFRAAGLTRLLLATSRLAHAHGKESHLTTVFTARKDGGLMSLATVRDATGLDLDAILASPDRPDVVQAELIWQQWAATYHDHATFTPDWTRLAVRQAKEMVGGRARLVAHLEVTDFGTGALNGPQIGTTVAAAVLGEPYGVDIYDAHLLDNTEDAARYLQTAWLRSQ